MRVGLKTHGLSAASAVLSILAIVGWASTRVRVDAHPRVHDARPTASVIHPHGAPAPIQESGRSTSPLPSPARFRESGGGGLLVQTWVNGVGPFTFAIDTGAGANILSRRVASEARVEVEVGGRGIRVGGLSGSGTVAAKRAFVRNFAIGTSGNRLPAQGLTVIAEGLPSDIDGVLDPTEAFGPLGYVIDLPAETISAFDPRLTPLRLSDAPSGGTVVRWLTEQGSRRPFVMLTEGRRALVDTGSGFGLAVSGDAARALRIVAGDGKKWEGARDLAGGEISSRRIRPATVHIGSLVLRNVPTDYLTRADSGAPVLLGRDALRPFQITFDPLNRLISFRPSQ